MPFPVIPPAIASFLKSIGLPATIVAAQALYGLIQKARGKEGGSSPFGDPARLEQMQAESPERLAFKKRIEPRVQNLLEQRLGELEQPYQSPYQRLAGTPSGDLLQQALPDMLRNLSGDPRRVNPQFLESLLQTLQPQTNQQQQQQQSPQAPQPSPNLEELLQESGATLQGNWPQENQEALLKDLALKKQYEEQLAAPKINPVEREIIKQQQGRPSFISDQYEWSG